MVLLELLQSIPFIPLILLDYPHSSSTHHQPPRRNILFPLNDTKKEREEEEEKFPDPNKYLFFSLYYKLLHTYNTQIVRNFFIYGDIALATFA
jgi:hypothetical protein